MEISIEEGTKYTICFDLLSEQEIFEPKTATSKKYQETLIQKHIVQQLVTYNKSDWIDKIWENKDIFYPKFKSDLIHKITFENWNNKIKSIKSELKKNKLLKHINNYQIDYRFTAIEVTPIEPLNNNILNSTIPSKMANNSHVTDKLCAELLGFGVVRLYKDSEDHINLFKIDSPEMKKIPGDDTTLAILAVPFYFSASDLLLGFFDEDDITHLSHIRLIKSSAPNRFMILLKFRSKDYVKPFLRKYQGRKFNSFEPETCTVIEIKEIIFRPKIKNNSDEISNNNIKVTLPYLLEDPFTNDNDPSSSSASSKKTTKSRNYTELATCPVCLDRLDSTVTGLFTIQCQHTFHSSCLSKWKDDTCPVCRYSNKSKNSINDLSLLSLSNSNNLYNNLDNNLDNTEKCMDCGLTEHLWICLICGNVGCGRYDQQHAIKHWEHTGHCFSMETNTQRVWDYAEDGYVHRLVQNEADGKIVELPLRDESKKTSDEKVEKIGFEYSKMLISQLESQREFYENKISVINNDLSFQKNVSTRFNEKITELENNLKKISTTLENNLKQLENSKKLQNDYLKLKNELDDMNALNDAFEVKLRDVTKENETLKAEKEELQEQVTDLMFFLESQEKFKDASDDVKEGQVIMVPKKTKKGGGNKKK